MPTGRRTLGLGDHNTALSYEHISGCCQQLLQSIVVKLCVLRSESAGPVSLNASSDRAGPDTLLAAPGREHIRGPDCSL